MLALKPDLARTMQRMEVLRQHSVLDRPVSFIALDKPDADQVPVPEANHATPADRWLDIEYQARLADASITNRYYLGDSLPIAFPNLGPGILAAFYGCPLCFGDGGTEYVTTVNGQLLEFDTATEIFKALGYMLPAQDVAAGRLIQFQYGSTLSSDETKLFFVSSTLEHPPGSGELYQDDLTTGKFSFIQQLPIGIYTAADLRDEHNIDLAHFGNQGNLWSGNVRLMVIMIQPCCNLYRLHTWIKRELDRLPASN